MKNIFKKAKKEISKIKVTVLNLANGEIEYVETYEHVDLTPIMLNGFDILKIEKI